jgi:hypothetical protein
VVKRIERFGRSEKSPAFADRLAFFGDRGFQVGEHHIALQQALDDRHRGGRGGADIRPDHRLPRQGDGYYDQRRRGRLCGEEPARFSPRGARRSGRFRGGDYRYRRCPRQPDRQPQAGKLQLKSAGALAFGPDGVLFVGDSLGGSVAAIDTNDRTAPKGAASINVDGLDAKIAAMVGVPADQIVVNDMKVNPLSKNVYLSVSRGKGPDAQPLIVKVDTAGAVSNVSLDNVKFSQVSLVDAPASNPGARQDPRTTTITDMNYVNGNLLVAGMSNEEWSSALRSIPVPFKNADWARRCRSGTIRTAAMRRSPRSARLCRTRLRAGSM